MFENLTETEQRFLEFINMLGSTALYQMGIIANPITGETEIDLKAAKMTVDILVMMKEKTKGNLTQVERASIEELVNHLQMNFVEKSKEAPADKVDAPKEEKVEPPKAEEPKKEESAPAAEKSDSDVELNWEKHERKNYGPSETE